MKRFLILFFLTACTWPTCGGLRAQVNPTPQQVSPLNEERWVLPEHYALDLGAGVTGPSRERLSRMFPEAAPSASFKVVAGVKGDRAVRRVKGKIPSHAEGYYLRMDADGVTVAGSDARGLLYGIETLRQLMADSTVCSVEVTDYPDVPFRGVVEGFYGTPWTHEARLRQLDFYGQNKLNVYLYGPKDDPYHSVPNWRKPYPEKEAAQLRELVARAKANGVLFYWAIHPGADIKWNATDRDLLLAKFEHMYELGVRAFAVFFDDISGEGAKADKQADLLNYIDDNFVAKKGDVAPLVMCPTEYNKAWANPAGGYLHTLGTKLNDDIEIMWTGNSVVHCIDKASMEWINDQIDRKAYIWWNYPVSDFCRDHLLMGPVYGNGLDIKDDVAAFVSNPMEHAEASKVALYSVADYAWNMDEYDSRQSWQRALRTLLPNCAEEFRTFASHSSDLGPNGHGFRRDESVELQPYLAAWTNSKGEDERAAMAVAAECGRLSAAADVLLADKENESLIREMAPWLRQARLVGAYGQAVVGMNVCLENGNSMDFMPLYRHAHALQQLMYENSESSNQNPYQPGVKVGGLVLLPSLNKMFTYAAVEYNRRENAALDTVAEYQPYTLESTVPQLRMQPVSDKGNEVRVSPSNEVITWPSGASLTVRMDKVRTLTGLSFDLGTTDISSDFKLDASADGTEWISIGLIQQEGKTTVHTTNEISGMQADRIRLTNVSGKELKVYLRSFKFTKRNQ